MGKDDNPTFVLVAGTALPAVAIVLVALRFYARKHRHARYGFDDWFALSALIFLIGLSIILIIGVEKHAFGYATATLLVSTLTDKLTYATAPFGILAIGCTKLSFIFFYRRIFVTGSAKHNIFGKITIAVIVLFAVWMAGMFFTFIFNCGKDISAQWDGQQQKCIKPVYSDNALAISDFLLDIIIFVLPIPMILHLHMTTARKIAVLAVFGFGSLALAASCVRMVLFYRITKQEPKQTDQRVMQHATNPNLVLTQGVYWVDVEAGLAVIACCLPTLHTLPLKTSAQSIFRSIRSATSLRSLRSHDSNNTRNFHSLSNEPIVPSAVKTASIHGYAMHAVTPTSREEEGGSANIWVNSKFEQTDNAV